MSTKPPLGTASGNIAFDEALPISALNLLPSLLSMEWKGVMSRPPKSFVSGNGLKLVEQNRPINQPLPGRYQHWLFLLISSPLIPSQVSSPNMVVVVAHSHGRSNSVYLITLDLGP